MRFLLLVVGTLVSAQEKREAMIQKCKDDNPVLISVMQGAGLDDWVPSSCAWLHMQGIAHRDTTVDEMNWEPPPWKFQQDVLDNNFDQEFVDYLAGKASWRTAWDMVASFTKFSPDNYVGNLNLMQERALKDSIARHKRFGGTWGLAPATPQVPQEDWSSWLARKAVSVAEAVEDAAKAAKQAAAKQATTKKTKREL